MAAGAAQVEKDANGCPLPPMDHLRPGASSMDAVAALVDGGTYDRKGGNPGPKVTPFGSADNKPPDQQDEQNVNDKGGDSKATENQSVSSYGKSDDAEDKIRREALADLAEIFPLVRVEWLLKCINGRVIGDKWDLQRTASWIFDYENFAPRKEVKRQFAGDFGTATDYGTIKQMLKGVKQDKPSPEYMFYGALKLSHKFPQFSMYSLRQVLEDLEYSYAAAAFAIVEGLEELMTKERKTWDDWERHQLIEIKVQRGDKWYLYPLCVVKGVKTWSKKKARMTPFPQGLAEEVRLVEKALYYYEQRRRTLMSKLDAERARLAQLDMAVKQGYACECPICCESCLPEELVNCTAGHEFCTFCLNRSVDEALAGQLRVSPEGDVSCLLPECEGVFTLRSLCYLLTGERMTRLEERIWTDFLARAEIANLFSCFACGYAEEVDAPVEAMRIFQCKNTKCRRKWCRECRNLWDTHIGKSCKEMAGDPEEELRKKYDNLMSGVVIRQCMKCNRLIQKDGGCNKMTCQCGSKMCYLCRKPITGYEHFCQHPTNPGELCSMCSGCRLWDDPQKVDDIMKAKLQRQLQEELFELKLAYAAKKAPAGSVIVGPKQPAKSVEKPAAGTGPERQFAAIFG